MGVPSSRTPVRVARGTYANLSTTNALAALQEGEIAFATDQDKLYVKEGGALTSISASSQSNPTPSDVTASPAFVSGTGTQADPYVITSGGVAFAGGTLESTQEITIDSGVGGDLVLFTDNSVQASGERFAGQAVGTIDSAGKYKFKLTYEDTPNTSVNNTTYNGLLQVGTTHFSWTVVQSNLTPLSQATATTVAGSLGSGSVLTATPGTVSGGTTSYSYATRWQRSLNGTDGWFDINATGNTYTQTGSDAGYYLRAVTTATDSTTNTAGGPLTLELPSSSTGQIPLTAAPVINQVTLAEANTGGSRFTSETFNVTANMVSDGTPVSTKSLKAQVTANFAQFPSMDSVSSNSASSNTNVGWNYYQPAQSSQYYYELVEQVKNPTTGVVNYISMVYQSSNNYMASSTDGVNWNALGNLGSGFSGSFERFQKLHGLLASEKASHEAYTWAESSASPGNQVSLAYVGKCIGITPTHVYGYNYSPRKVIRYERNSTTGQVDTTTRTEGGANNFYLNSHGYTAAGNGKIVYGGRRTDGSSRVYVMSESNFSTTATWENDKNFGAHQNTDPNYLRFVAGYFWINFDGVVYRSSDGITWSSIANPTGTVSYDPFTYVDGYLYGIFNRGSNNQWYVYRSANFGASWQQVSQGFTGGNFNPQSILVGFNGKYLLGGYRGSSYNYYNGVYVSDFFLTQTVTLSSTNGLSSFNNGDAIRKEGEADLFYHGIIQSISGSNVTIRSGYEFQAGDVIEAIASTGSQSSSKYVVMNTQGAVSGLTSTDPGFVTFGPGTSHTITFPATLSSGGAPDDELPSGTSMNVTVRASNSVNTDDYTSNSVTPA